MFKIVVKKILLIVLGIFLSLLILECGLRLAGLTISYYQQYKNNKALKNKSQYTIMCLGESTTQGQYPIQLQEILNKKYPNKFSIIDCGIVATKVETILECLDENINKYNPNIAICMIGINDNLCYFETDNKFSTKDKFQYRNMIYKLKIYKLFVLLKKHIFQDNKVYANDIKYEEIINLFYRYRRLGDYTKAEEVLKKMLKENPNDELVFAELAYLYNDFDGKENISYEMAIEGIEKGYNIKKGIYYEIIFDYNLKNNNMLEFKNYIDYLISKDLELFSSESKYFLYSSVKNYINEEQRKKILKEMLKNNVSDYDYGILAIEFIEKKDYIKAQEYFDKVSDIRLKYPNEKLYNLYNLIIKKLIDKNIKVICMQYPVISIESLQKQLENKFYYNKITFISNEQNFKEALMNKNYNEIFTDQFAGDFGHCTDLGNTMIAENVVNTLEKLLDLKNK